MYNVLNVVKMVSIKRFKLTMNREEHLLLLNGKASIIIIFFTVKNLRFVS